MTESSTERDRVEQALVAARRENKRVLVKIDQDRMKGAKEVIQRIRKPTEGAGIPWYAFLDRDGRTLITSTKPGAGNIGFPADPKTEIPYFTHMLKTTKSKVADADIEFIAAELKTPK